MIVIVIGYSGGYPVLTGVSGGGVATWHSLGGYGNIFEVAWGVVTTAGSNTATITYNSVSSADTLAVSYAEFASSNGSAWAQDSASWIGYTGSGTTWTASAITAAEDAILLVALDQPTIGQGLYSVSVASPAMAEAVGSASLYDYPIFYLLDTGTTSESVEIAAGGGTMSAGAFYEFFLYVPAPSSAPARPRRSNVAVQRAANWFKRETGLWSPESGLIPRAA